VVALAAVAGSLWLSAGMGLKACPLCLYQRTFVMGVAAVLEIGVLTAGRHRAAVLMLALPLAVAGFSIAVFHVFLEWSGKLECPAGFLGIATAPHQSLAVFTLLLAATVLGLVWSWDALESWWPALLGPVLGLLLAWGAVASAPPMPQAPAKAYEAPLDMCRPPFHSQ
jgi:hypothetical protein